MEQVVVDVHEEKEVVKRHGKKHEDSAKNLQSQITFYQ